jgi:Bacterial TSP3 repeat
MPRRLVLPLLALALTLVAPAAAAAKPRDRDHDRLPDKWEKHYGLSTHKRSAKGDPDHDRLSNLREYRLRTNPRRKDTDRDGLSDGAEVHRWHTNPRRKDTDRDGLKDGAEVHRWHTNPRRKDTDGDGYSDGLEVRSHTNPRSKASHPAGAPDIPQPSQNKTSSPQPATCSTAPNTAGGPDPWGGCFPGPANTGVPSGTALTPYTGPCTITTANTLINAKTVNCDLTIHAANVVITRSAINGSVWIDDENSPYSFTVTDSDINGGGPSGEGNGKSHFTILRSDIHGGYRGVWCEYDCTVADSYIHDQARDPNGQQHESALRMGSDSDPAHGQVIEHNTLLCNAPDVAPDAGCSADLTGYGDFAPIRNNTVTRNLMLATTGGTCAYGGSSGDDGSKPYGAQAANNVFTENIFQHRNSWESSGHCGYWFAIADFDSRRPGNRWVGNRWDTGGLVVPGD